MIRIFAIIEQSISWSGYLAQGILSEIVSF